IQDNIRNILLQLLHTSFIMESTLASSSYAITRQVYKDMVLPHTKQHLNFLLDVDADWSISLHSYHNLIIQIEALIRQLGHLLLIESEKIEADLRLFRWRECDHFVQNLSAVRTGLHRL